MRTRIRTVLITAALMATSAGLAQAQTTLTVSPATVPPGATVTAQVGGPAGDHFVVIGSAVNSGFSYGGVSLAVGPDVVILAQGVLDGSGSASVGVIPPFNGTTLDRYYLQAVTSASASFLPPSPSAGRVVRNSDASSGGVSGTTVQGLVSTVNGCLVTVIATTPLAITSATRIFVSGRASYALGSSNLLSGLLFVNLRDSSSTIVARTFRALGTLSSGTDPGRTPISVGQILKAGSPATNQDYVAMPGNYTLEMTLQGADGTCTGTGQAWDPTLTYLLLGAP